MEIGLVTSLTDSLIVNMEIGLVMSHTKLRNNSGNPSVALTRSQSKGYNIQ